MRSETRSTQAAAEISRVNAFFPIMPLLGNRWAASRPFEGRTIALAAHMTTLTGALVRELALGGGEWVICGASPATTNHAVVELLRDNGLAVYTRGGREDAHLQVFDHEPDLVVDVGGDLISDLVKRRPETAANVRGAVEITKTGITRLAAIDLPFGVVNINDGRLKPAVENRHGVGEGLWHAVQRLTGMHLSGRRVGVVGYGPVGAGVAAYARAAGANVVVAEIDPVRRLFAHYDGYPTPSLEELLASVGICVTCTGHSSVIKAPMLSRSRDGLVLINAGHGGDEFDTAGIKDLAVGVDNVADHVVRYRLEDGPTVVILGNGHPLNIVTNAGSPEPVLLHFALLGLTLEWLADNDVPVGQLVVPTEIETRAAQLALKALGMAHG